jgi:hypothetical protein
VSLSAAGERKMREEKEKNNEGGNKMVEGKKEVEETEDK